MSRCPLDIRKASERAFARLERWLRALPPPLREAGSALPRALGAPEGERLFEAWGERLAFLVATPVLVAEHYRITRARRVAEEAAYGALAGYFHVRIQDNVLDEPERFDSSYLLLGNELVAEFFGVYHGLFPPGHRFWHYFRRYWRETSRFTLWEKVAHAGRHAPFHERDLPRLGKKHGGAKIPMAAVCLAAGREQDIPRYARFLDAVHLADQLVNDVLSVTKDLRHHHLSYVAGRALCVARRNGGALAEAEGVVGRTLLTTELEEVLDRACRLHETALEGLGPLARAFDAEVRKRLVVVRELREHMIRAKVTTLLGFAAGARVGMAQGDCGAFPCGGRRRQRPLPASMAPVG